VSGVSVQQVCDGESAMWCGHVGGAEWQHVWIGGEENRGVRSRNMWCVGEEEREGVL
jgi:hypothetical protein